jgi:hypothetical protein
MQRTYRALAALALGAGAAMAAPLALTPLADAASLFGAEPLADGSTVALAQPVDAGRWNLVVVERLQGATGCWQRLGDGRVSVDPEALSNESLCNRLQSSSGYSLRADGQDLGSPWRLRIEAVGNRLELQALNPSLPAPITIGTAQQPPQGDTTALAAFSLNPGWSFQKRSYGGRLLSHVYLNSREPLRSLQARARGLAPASAALPTALPPVVVSSGRSRDLAGQSAPGNAGVSSNEPAPGQVIALQVVPFSDDPGITASN